MDYDIDKIISEIDFSKNSFKECSNGLFLTNYEISILEKYKINYLNCISLKDIIFLIEDILSEDDTLEDLENISKSISERDYYLNTNK